MQKPLYKRVLLKLSGESLMGDQQFGLNASVLKRFAEDVSEIYKLGVEIGIVIGGGNFFRGIQATEQGIDKVSGDYMGMLATVINGIAFQNALEMCGVPTRLQTAIHMQQIAEPYIRRRAIRHFEKKRVVLFGAGTGNPYFTTDTAAALRAIEIEADVIIKGTRVDGIYDSDPELNPNAKRYNEISYQDVLVNGLKVMDATAIALCQDNSLPIMVFNMNEPGNLKRLICGENVATIVK
ncbi:uridylate kinase [Chlorobiota bacterium]|nr:uridylate kinase [Chlorobiota bacterium]